VDSVKWCRHSPTTVVVGDVKKVSLAASSSVGGKWLLLFYYVESVVQVGIRLLQYLYLENGFRKMNSEMGCAICEMLYRKRFS